MSDVDGLALRRQWPANVSLWADPVEAQLELADPGYLTRHAIPRGRPYGWGRPCPDLSATDAAYIAGFVDAEASIGVSATKPGKRWPYGKFELHVVGCMTTPDVFDWLAATTGFKRRPGTYTNTGNPAAAPSYSWRIYSVGAASLLAQVLPYLRLKRRQAELLIAVHSALLADPTLKRDTAWLAKVKQGFHDLNARGAGSAATREGVNLAEVTEL